MNIPPTLDSKRRSEIAGKAKQFTDSVEYAVDFACAAQRDHTWERSQVYYNDRIRQMLAIERQRLREKFRQYENIYPEAWGAYRVFEECRQIFIDLLGEP